MSGDRIVCGDGAERLLLERADTNDKDAVVALQFAAYARNRELLGLEPLPLLTDYGEIFADYEVWVRREDDGIGAVLILEPRPDDLLIWSVATDPSRQSKGLGGKLLAAADARARELGRTVLRLYTGSTLNHLIEWYGRHGFTVEHIEQLEDRAITHMVKHLA